MVLPGYDRLSSVLLAIETAGSACSAAVVRDGVVLAAERRRLRHGHAEVLLPLVEQVMQEAGVSPAQLGVVAAAVGPGGFTGIRVGLAAAHGIGLAAGARLIGVSCFAAVAAAAAGAGERRALLVALDSRRADLYVQLFASDRAAPLAPPQATLPDRLAEYVASATQGKPLLIAGDAAETAAAALEGQCGLAIAANSAPDALGVAAVALEQLQSGAPAGPMRPLYLRPPDVTLPRRDRMPSRLS